MAMNHLGACQFSGVNASILLTRIGAPSIIGIGHNVGVFLLTGCTQAVVGLPVSRGSLGPVASGGRLRRTLPLSWKTTAQDGSGGCPGSTVFFGAQHDDLRCQT